MLGHLSLVLLPLQLLVLGPALDASASGMVAATHAPGKITLYTEKRCGGTGTELEVKDLSKEEQNKSECVKLEADNAVESARLEEDLPSDCRAYFYNNDNCHIQGLTGFLYTSDDLYRRGKGVCVDFKAGGPVLSYRYMCF